MAERFTTIDFYADLVDGIRRPIAKNQEPDPDPVENPDPGGDGGGSQNPGGDTGGGGPDQGTGGDIGNPTGAGETVLGPAPTITRKTHSQDIFVARGGTMSITYVASAACTMLPKGGYEDMVFSYATNGYEMTLTWTCPADEAGDSTYIGCEVHAYGADNSEAIRTLWDRLHVGTKVEADVIYASDYPQHTTIRAMARNLANVAGRTLIIPDGTYSNRDDALTLGYTDMFGNNPEIAEGIYTPKGSLTTNDLGESYQDYDVTKFTNVMAETPMGIKLERNTYDNGIVLYGNAPYPGDWGNTGNRSVIAFKALGFSIRNCAYAHALMTRTIRCSINYGTTTQDILYNQTPNRPGWKGGGTSIGTVSNLKANFEHIGCITNERLMINNGRSAFGSKYNTVIATNGCTQLVDYQRTQTFINYGGNSTDWHNCYALDSVDFAGGTLSYLGKPVYPNVAFMNTNGQNNTITARGCGMFRDVRAGWESNTSGQRSGARDKIINSCFWDRDGNALNGGPNVMIRGGALDIDGVTVGKNSNFSQVSTYTTYPRNSNVNNIITSLLALSPQWDYLVGNDQVISDEAFAYNSIGNLAIITNYDIAAGIIAIAAEYFRYTKANAKQRGAHYVTRLEEGSILSQNGTGARNIFIKYGRYGRFFGDTDSTTAYDGTGGKPYVNALSRTPWLEMRAERQLYDCTSNGGRYRGNTGWATPGVNPIDYMNRFGTTDLAPLNCPPIEDIYGYVDGSTAWLRWRPVCPAYRSTIIGYEIYVDGIKVSDQQPKSSIAIPLTGVASGTRIFNIVVKDSVNGNSGKSRNIYLTIP